MNKPVQLLVIDDDRVNIFIVDKLIMNSGFKVEVTEKYDGEDAINHLLGIAEDINLIPDIIFLDLNMPLMDGWQFLNALEKLKLDKEIDVYMLTASIFKQDELKALSYPAVKGFIVKPLTKYNLREVFEPMIAKINS